MYPTNNRNRNAAGFGLTELLVAMAIFLAVMGGVMLVFNGSLRVLRQAEQNQDVFEMVRGAMSLMEKDLSLAFVSREHGDVYQFYGTPIGFTYIGLTRFGPDNEPNLARVTYVLRPGGTGDFGNRAGQVDFLRFDPDNPDYPLDEDREVETFSLIRYVERGADDLESFPVNWEEDVVDASSTLQELIGDTADPLGTALATVLKLAVQTGLCTALDVACLTEVEKAAKRELWIQMLSGQNINLPDIWDGAHLDLDPEDYVVLENIVYDNQEDLAKLFPQIAIADTAAALITTDRSAVLPHLQLGLNGSMFQYVQWATIPGENFVPPREDQVAPRVLAFWNDRRNISLFNNGLDDDADGLVDCLDFDELDPIADATDGVDNDLDGLIDCDADELPISWMTDGIDNDGDGFTDAADLNGDWEFALGPGTGSPLSADLPEQVQIRFRLFFQSPIAGAPDFERNFMFDVDIPAGFRRIAPN